MPALRAYSILLRNVQYTFRTCSRNTMKAFLRRKRSNHNDASESALSIIDQVRTESDMQNDVILQGFEWYSPGEVSSTSQDAKGVAKDRDISHWQYLTDLLPNFVDLGIAEIWIPPACKATNVKDVGYGIYDLYDLGEFDAKGSVRTRWGTKQELKQLCAKAASLGVGIIFDAVLNHKAAADASEECLAVRVDPKNRVKEIDRKPRTVETWTKFNFSGRKGKYSNMQYNHSHLSGVDWDSKQREKAIFKFVGQRPDGTNKDWAQDVGRSENGNYDYLMFADVDFANNEVREDVKRWGCWLIDELPGLRSFRLDAIKHYSATFQKEFIEHVTRYAEQKRVKVSFIGEYWSANSQTLSQHITKSFGGILNMFDVKLMYNFHDISEGRLRDLRKVFDKSLVSIDPHHAVTFVTNHDTQETQSLAAPVQPWFIPHAYALILLRKGGQPCVFWGDVYGTNGPQPRLPACGGRLLRLVKARQLFSHGSHRDYFSDDHECVAWSRNQSESGVNRAMAVVVSISWSWKKTRILVGAEYAGQIWTDLMGWAWSGVLIDLNGYGDFPVGPRSVSVWTWQKIPGRERIDALVYAEDPRLVPDSDVVGDEVLPSELRS